MRLLAEFVPGGLVARFKRGLSDEDGSATIESLMWLFCLFSLLILMTDASLGFYGKAQAFRVLQDGNRAYSVGRLTTTAAVETWLKRAIAPLGPHATATTTVSGGVVVSTLVVPASDFMLFDSMGSFNITVRSEHYVE